MYLTRRAHPEGSLTSPGIVKRGPTRVRDRLDPSGEPDDAFAPSSLASADQLAARSGLSAPTVYTALESLASLGLVRELTGRERGRLFSYDKYLRILSEGTEPVIT
jgi:DNA-binding transcriptional ArsR family regulator